MPDFIYITWRSNVITFRFDLQEKHKLSVLFHCVQCLSQTPALLTISETDPYNYGTLATGASQSHTFTITNTGEFQATVMTETTVAAPFVYTGGGATYPGAAGDCGVTLAGGATCTIEVAYSPTVPAAPDNGTITQTARFSPSESSYSNP